MVKWQTIAVTTLSTLALSGACFTTYRAYQPTHYEGTTFVNEKHTTSHSTDSNMATSSSSTSHSSSSTTASSTDSNSIPAQSASVADQQLVIDENTAERPLQMGGTGFTYDTPLTFSVYTCGMAETNQGRMEVGVVVCNEIGQKTRMIPIDDCEPFAQWMRSIASDKTNLDNSMDSNYNYWKTNVKGQQ